MANATSEDAHRGTLGRRSLIHKLQALDRPSSNDIDVEDVDRLETDDAAANSADEAPSQDNSSPDKSSDLARAHYLTVGTSLLRARGPADANDLHLYAGERTDRAAIFNARASDRSSSPLSRSRTDPTQSSSNFDVSSESTTAGESREVESSEQADDFAAEATKYRANNQEAKDDFDDDSVSEGENRPDDDDESVDRRQEVDRISALKSMLANDSNSTVSEAAKTLSSDANKGRAVKAQITVFETLLDARIRMQRLVQDANKASPLHTAEKADDGALKATHSCLKLVETLYDLRARMIARDLEPNQYGNLKRKWAAKVDKPVDLSTISADVTEKRDVLNSWRDSILMKWARRVNATNGHAQDSSRKFKAFRSTERLDPVQQLRDLKGDRSRFAQRARTKRFLSASQQATAEDDEVVYDDGDYYQDLLRELIDSRTIDATDQSTSADAGLTGASRLVAQRNAMHAEQRRRQLDRRGRDGAPLDTRASKGRKLRFNIHEKLQNFLAPEMTMQNNWHEGQVDELFGSLLGQSVAVVDENVTVNQRDIDTDATTVTVGNDFRLFG
ncbi:rRNA-processing protein bfr2 [Savitreella phatthalungensis]